MVVDRRKGTSFTPSLHLSFLKMVGSQLTLVVIALGLSEGTVKRRSGENALEWGKIGKSRGSTLSCVGSWERVMEECSTSRSRAQGVLMNDRWKMEGMFSESGTNVCRMGGKQGKVTPL
ncbi:hypothetical protein MLD38_028659 [Melastoma candidum]|uniref:Uncharacterized protein n=1 Tax=Melastoma candidum TaxID=119954 RepID=A0ACB9N428_9MYRT|nr:hypothetical protein MLD38_028659 [Melastoma candidum]